MRDFSKVSPAVWESARFASLPGSDDKLAYLYLLSCRHANSVGCFRLPLPYAAADLHWKETRVSSALDELHKHELAEFDPGTMEIFIPRWLRHNPPTNSKHYMGALRNVESIASEKFRDLAKDALAAAWQKRQGGAVQTGQLSAQSSVSNALLEKVKNGGR